METNSLDLNGIIQSVKGNGITHLTRVMLEKLTKEELEKLLKLCTCGKSARPIAVQRVREYKQLIQDALDCVDGKTGVQSHTHIIPNVNLDMVLNRKKQRVIFIDCENVGTTFSKDVSKFRFDDVVIIPTHNKTQYLQLVENPRCARMLPVMIEGNSKQLVDTWIYSRITLFAMFSEVVDIYVVSKDKGFLNLKEIGVPCQVENDFDFLGDNKEVRVNIKSLLNLRLDKTADKLDLYNNLVEESYHPSIMELSQHQQVMSVAIDEEDIEPNEIEEDELKDEVIPTEDLIKEMKESTTAEELLEKLKESTPNESVTKVEEEPVSKMEEEIEEPVSKVEEEIVPKRTIVPSVPMSSYKEVAEEQPITVEEDTTDDEVKENTIPLQNVEQTTTQAEEEKEEEENLINDDDVLEQGDEILDVEEDESSLEEGDKILDVDGDNEFEFLDEEEQEEEQQSNSMFKVVGHTEEETPNEQDEEEQEEEIPNKDTPTASEIDDDLFEDVIKNGVQFIKLNMKEYNEQVLINSIEEVSTLMKSNAVGGIYISNRYEKETRRLLSNRFTELAIDNPYYSIMQDIQYNNVKSLPAWQSVYQTVFGTRPDISSIETLRQSVIDKMNESYFTVKYIK